MVLRALDVLEAHDESSKSFSLETRINTTPHQEYEYGISSLQLKSSTGRIIVFNEVIRGKHPKIEKPHFLFLSWRAVTINMVIGAICSMSTKNKKKGVQVLIKSAIKTLQKNSNLP